MFVLALYVPLARAALPETDFYAFGPVDPARVVTDTQPTPPWAEVLPTTTFRLDEVDDACERAPTCAAWDPGAHPGETAPSDAFSADDQRLLAAACVGIPSTGASAAQLAAVTSALKDPAAVRRAMSHARANCDQAPPKSAERELGAAAHESPGGAAAALAQPSTILLGATDYFLDRAVDEVADWGVDRFLTQICKDDGAAVRSIGPIRPGALVPQSCDALTHDRTGSLAGTLDDLIAVAMRDLIGLPRHTAEELLRADARSLLPDKEAPHELTPAARDALVSLAVLGRVVELVAEGRAASDALGDWARDAQPAWPDIELTESARAKRVADGQTTEVDERDMADASTTELYAHSITLEDDAGPYVLWLASLAVSGLPTGAVEVAFAKASGKLEAQFTVDAERLDALKDRLPLTLALNLLGNISNVPAPVGSTQIQALANLGGRLLDGYEEAREVVRLVLSWKLKAMSGERGTPESVAEAAGEIALAAGTMGESGLDAAAAIVDLLGLNTAKTPLGDRLAAMGAILKDATGALSLALDKEYADALQAGLRTVYDVVDAVPGDTGKARAALAALSRGIDFVVALSEAKDPASAKAAIEAVAAPTGGYLAKRRGTQPLYATLNGYVGGGGGVEWTLPATGVTATGETTPDANVAGAAWPAIAVGPEFGVRVDRFHANAWSLGLQAQLLDLGVLGQYRLEGGGDNVTDLTFQHVFSPGVNLAFGIPQAPFTVLLGGAWAPALRDVETSTGAIEVRDADAIRAGITLAVDIPVIH